jgi:8-oxo-dGTP pyrophosphatase MutT (NUDIX family)
MADNNLTCMSYWLPKLEAAGLPTPRTKLIPMPRNAYIDILNLFDGNPLRGAALPFLAAVKEASEEIGLPVFLRTGLTSGKHNWENTCCLTDSSKVLHHVASIVEFSECCDFIGLACDWWAVREFLPTIPLGICPRYGNMPVCREFRCFVRDGEVLCMHSYWPANALETGGVDRSEELAAELAWCPQETIIRDIAARAGAAIGGAWSVDILETRRGWYVTDMAEASKSFHWPGCTRD